MLARAGVSNKWSHNCLASPRLTLTLTLTSCPSASACIEGYGCWEFDSSLVYDRTTTRCDQLLYPVGTVNSVQQNYSANHCLNQATALSFPLVMASLSPSVFSSPFVKHPCATPGKCTHSTGKPSLPCLSRTYASIRITCRIHSKFSILTSVWNALILSSLVNAKSTSGAKNCTGALPYPSISSSVTHDGCAPTMESTSGGSCSFAPNLCPH
jgi:hypothetical protein